jgi:hypothetical protein
MKPVLPLIISIKRVPKQLPVWVTLNYLIYYEAGLRHRHGVSGYEMLVLWSH